MMKKLVAIILCSTLLCTVFPMWANAEDGSENGALFSQDNYNGYDMEWINNGTRDFLVSASTGTYVITYEYDSAFNRISKATSDGSEVLFTYDDDNRLVSEQRDGHTFLYTYDEMGQMFSVVVDNITYFYEIENGSVSSLKDVQGNVVVHYTYSNRLVDKVYGVDAEGNLADMTEDESFVGNLNRITYHAYYYDIETGWYYCGRFYDPSENRYVDGQVGIFDAFMENLEKLLARRSVQMTVAELGTYMHTYCMNEPYFGLPCDYDYESEWYAELSNIDAVARTIYGECINVTEDEQAISWVIWNRMCADEENFGGATMWGVVTQADQFTALTGSEGETKRARFEEGKNATAWDYAVKCASYIYAAEYLGGAIDTSLIPKPTGYDSNQLYFNSYLGFTSSVSDSLWHSVLGANIKDLAIPGEGKYTTKASVINSYPSRYIVVSEDGDVTYTVNIYFNEDK